MTSYHIKTNSYNITSNASKEDMSSDINIQDFSKESESIIYKVIKGIGKSTATQQLILGTASGYLSGYLMMKVVKVAAVIVGSGMILLQIANHNGYAKINSDMIYKNVEEQVDKIEVSSPKSGSKLLYNMRSIFKNNSNLSASFTGGLLIGAAYS